MLCALQKACHPVLHSPRGLVCSTPPSVVAPGPASTRAASRLFQMSRSSWEGAVPIRPAENAAGNRAVLTTHSAWYCFLLFDVVKRSWLSNCSCYMAACHANYGHYFVPQTPAATVFVWRPANCWWWPLVHCLWHLCCPTSKIQHTEQACCVLCGAHLGGSILQT